MTRIVVKSPTPASQRYTPQQIHELVCEREAKWANIPIINKMIHSRSDSVVSYIAWQYYTGTIAVEDIAKRYKTRHGTLTAAHLERLARALGIKRVKAQWPTM